jgi:glycosyltransferase involved in cell wall biosynthesis
MHSEHYHLPFYLIERFGVKFYKYFLPYTQAYDAKMKKHNNRVISQVTAEGVSDEFFQIKKMSPKYILSIGRFDIAQKGLDLLIRAYAKIKDEIPYPLIVAGRGPDEAKIKKLIVKLNLQQKVFIKPPAFGNEKSRLLSESVFVVLPSKFETFSGFALEAMASGSPLVIFDIPGLKWISEKCCFRAKPYDENEYADLMLKACNIPETLRQMGVDAKIFAKQFSWDDVAAKYDNFLNLVINKYEK